MSLLIKGLGLFNDGYHFGVMFFINLIMMRQYPDQFTHTMSSYMILSMFIASAIGQLLFGILGDIYGRSRMMFISCIILIFGGILCSSVYSNDTETLIYLLTISRFILGIGIGGEYPTSVASAYESIPYDLHYANHHQRQLKNVSFIQLLQLSGMIMAGLIAYILIEIFVPHQTEYNPHDLEIVWRLLFVIGILPQTLNSFFTKTISTLT